MVFKNFKQPKKTDGSDVITRLKKTTDLFSH